MIRERVRQVVRRLSKQLSNQSSSQVGIVTLPVIDLTYLLQPVVTSVTKSPGNQQDKDVQIDINTTVE